MAASIRQFALLLVFLTAMVLARQPGTLPRRRIAVRGTTSSHITDAHHRRLGVGHGGDGGKGKGGDKASGKSEKSPKSSSGGGKHKGDHEQDDDDEEEVKEPHVDSEDLPSADDDSSEDEDEDGKSPKGGPGTKGDKGEGKDEEKDDGKGKGKGKGSEHFQHEDVETFKRAVPDFAINYVIASSRRAETPADADYNELSVVSEEFLDRMFGSVFEDLAVGHFGTAAYALINEETPYEVSFRVTLDFAIPGEVPTVQFLIDRLQEAFERETSRTNYLFDLNTMSETNPFSATTSFSLVTGSGSNNNGLVGGPGSTKPPKVSNEDAGITKNHIIIFFMGCIGMVVLVLAAFLWLQGRNRKRRFRPSSHSDSSATLPFYNGKLGIDSRGDETEQSADSDEYNADDETDQYLSSLRQRYKDQVNEIQPGANKTPGFRDFIENQSEIKEENHGILFLKLDDQQTAQSAYGGEPPMQPVQQEEKRKVSVRDLLNMELGSTDTDLEDDLGNLMN